MPKMDWHRLATLIPLAALPLVCPAQDVASVLEPLARAMKADEVTAARYVAAGSGYEEADPADAATGSGSGQGAASDTIAGAPAASAGPSTENAVGSETAPPDAGRRHYRIVTHTEELNLESKSLRVETTRATADRAGGAAPRTDERSIDADAPWPERLRFWTSPYGFVSGAPSAEATLTTETIAGSEYRIASFVPDGGREVRGYIDEQDRLVRVVTDFEDASGATMSVEASFLHWEDLDGVLFPTTLIRKHDGELTEVLIVTELDATAAGE